MLELAGAERRGGAIAQRMVETLREFGLTTEPDFRTAWIDRVVTVKLLGTTGETCSVAPSELDSLEPQETDPAIADMVLIAGDYGEDITSVAEPLNVSAAQAGVVEVPLESRDSTTSQSDNPDPVRRIGSIASANRGVVSVNLQDRLETATTLMALEEYSQLAIMQGERSVKGMISWESVAKRMLRAPNPVWVSECRVDAQVIEFSAALFEALPTIEKHGYVMVAGQGKVTGIVTASDVATELRTITYAFTSIGVIEGLIRRKLHPLVLEHEIQSLEEHSRARQRCDIRLATFGENIRLLQRDSVWQRMQLNIEKKQFVSRLERIREIRNDVMHFNPDPLDAGQKKELQQMEAFLREIFG